MKIAIFLILISLFYSCDSAYDLSFIVDNKSKDTILLEYDYKHKIDEDTTTIILPNERKIFLMDFIIRKASSFDDCCPCKFNYIRSSDTTAVYSNADNWEVEKQDKNYNNNDGFVNCIFIKN